jgi:hypothetical protein
MERRRVVKEDGREASEMWDDVSRLCDSSKRGEAE